jgi:hypothetical protein
MKGFKLIILLLPLLFGTRYLALGQSFYKDYKYHLLHQTGKVSPVRRHLIGKVINQLRLATDLFEKTNKHSFFSSDTIYYLYTRSAETATTQQIIWNKGSSCYCIKDVNKKPIIGINASNIINSFTPSFGKAIEMIDTTAYHSYAIQNKVLDGEYVSVTVGVKVKNHWCFFMFKENGWAINYDFDLGSKQQ